MIEAVKVGALTPQATSNPESLRGSAFLIQNGKVVEAYSANILVTTLKPVSAFVLGEWTLIAFWFKCRADVTFPVSWHFAQRKFRDREDAIANIRDACATQIRDHRSRLQPITDPG